MSDRVFTLAVWDVAGGRWVAGVTSPVRARIEAVHLLFRDLVPAFAQVVEVDRDEVEAIEAAVSALPAVDAVSVFCLHQELCELVQEDARRIAEAITTGARSFH